MNIRKNQFLLILAYRKIFLVQLHLMVLHYVLQDMYVHNFIQVILLVEKMMYTHMD